MPKESLVVPVKSG